MVVWFMIASALEIRVAFVTLLSFGACTRIALRAGTVPGASVFDDHVSIADHCIGCGVLLTVGLRTYTCMCTKTAASTRTARQNVTLTALEVRMQRMKLRVSESFLGHIGHKLAHAP